MSNPCPRCSQELNRGTYKKDGTWYNEFYCANDYCDRRFELVAVLPMPPLEETA